MSKIQINSKIEEQVANVLFNIKSVTGVYLITSDISKRKAALDIISWNTGVKINWLNGIFFNITLNLAVNSKVSVSLTYNLIKNLLEDAFMKVPKVKMNSLYINILDIQEKRKK